MTLVTQYAVDHWLAEHISILWLLQHPLISVLGLMVGLVLFSRLLMAIATLIDRLWLWILRLPIILFKSIFTSGDKSQDTVAPTINYELTTNSEKSEQILQKLNAIEQQQKKILQELAAMKNSEYAKQNNQLKLVKQLKGKG